MALYANNTASVNGELNSFITGCAEGQIMRMDIFPQPDYRFH